MDDDQNRYTVTLSRTAYRGDEEIEQEQVVIVRCWADRDSDQIEEAAFAEEHPDKWIPATSGPGWEYGESDATDIDDGYERGDDLDPYELASHGRIDSDIFR